MKENNIRRKNILLDFDGTIVFNNFPNIGEPIPSALETIKELQKHHNIVLFTMRNNDNPVNYKGKLLHRNLLQEAVDWCKEHAIELSEVNEIKSQKYWTSTTHKLYSPLRIDDDNAGIPLKYKNGIKYVDWNALRVWLEDNEWIPVKRKAYKPISDSVLKALVQEENPMLSLFDRMKLAPEQTVYSHMNISYEAFVRDYKEWLETVEFLEAINIFKEASFVELFKSQIRNPRAEEYIAYRFLDDYLNKQKG